MPTPIASDVFLPIAWTRVWRLVLVLATALVAGCATTLPPNTGRTPSRAIESYGDTALGRLTEQRRAASASRSDSAFMLLPGADDAMSSRLALIDAAQRSLDLQYYAIHADNSTELLLQKIRDAARRGVRVRVLIDDFNLVGKDAQVLRLAFESNVEIRLFNPIAGSRNSLMGRAFTALADLERLQKRMHNKLFIADNAMGITGGRNLGDAYFGSGDVSNFLDLDVLAAGRVVRDMSASFDHYWNDELAYPMQRLVSAQDLEDLRKLPSASTAAPANPPQSPTATAPITPRPTPASTASQVMPDASPSAVVDADTGRLNLRTIPLVWAPSVLLADQPGKIGPGDDEVDAGETLIDGLLSLMEQARQEVLIVSPYFVPGKPMMEVFARMRAKGVSVRVLTNSLASNDAPAAHAGYARYRHDLLGLGIDLYEMRADQEGTAAGAGLAGSGGGRRVAAGSKTANSHSSLHAKAVTIDGRLAVIGSMNLDLRSQRQNSEVALAIRSPVLSQQLRRQFETTVTQGAYRLGLDGDRQLVWRAPQGARFTDARSEPDATARQKALVFMIGPFAPDEML
ncbi:phospholipase D family protein [Caenimonas sp. SL110]|uniref:phospholipase D family protein n=1 Tax=Caenimonas sp. SL110 TaxID=1450524 RepID=UPI000654B82E|nr:phospholipase D family protein [Caenimonas sp. SL110]